MNFNIVVLLMGLGVGYAEQMMWVFVTAVVIFVYRWLEVIYFKSIYDILAVKAYEQSKWVGFTAIVYLLWASYLLYKIVDILFKG